MHFFFQLTPIAYSNLLHLFSFPMFCTIVQFSSSNAFHNTFGVAWYDPFHLARIHLQCLVTTPLSDRISLERRYC
uniref:Secreted protein n=1 Tax=Ascaris lumbricoides TaxID=6252 RepID=A0A0M3HZR1_ASCLU